MNYQRIYTQLIKRAQNRTLEGYTEKHHILPKCLGGSNDKENLVRLTAREHFLCHRLLCEIYPQENKLKHSLWLMAIGKQQSYKHVLSSRTYQILKENFIESIKGNKNMLGKKHSEETKLKMGVSKLGKKDSEETKINKSKAATGKIKTQEHKNNISLNHPTKKPIIQLDLSGFFIRGYISINEASRQTGYRVSDISACCNNKRKTAFGFIWRFK